MDGRRVTHFSYYSELRKNEVPLVHKLRDGNAFSEVMEALRDRGYRYDRLIINTPDAAPHAYDSYAFTPDDLLVVTTRPPLSDDYEKRKIARTGTSMEARFLTLIGQYFQRCSIDNILLRKELADCLTKPGFRDLADLRFWATKDSRHARSAYRRPSDGPPHTVAYLLFIETEAWPGGPGVLCSFALGGPYTLLWNHWLRTNDKVKGLVRDAGSRFVVADITIGPGVSSAWTDLSPADSWAVDYDPVALRPQGGTWVPVAPLDEG